MSDSLWPHGRWPVRLLCPWDSPGENTGVVAFPSPGDLPDPGIKPGSLPLQVDSLPAELPGKPFLVKGQIVNVWGFSDLGCGYSDSAVVVCKQPEVINMQKNMWGCVLIKFYLPKKIVDQIWLRGSSLLISHLVELSRWGIQMIFLPLLIITHKLQPIWSPVLQQTQVFLKVKCHVHCSVYILTI